MGPWMLYVSDKAGIVKWRNNVTPIFGGKEGEYHLFASPMLADEAWQATEKRLKDELYDRVFNQLTTEPSPE